MNLRHLFSVFAALAFLFPTGCKRHPTMTTGLSDTLKQASEKIGHRVAADFSVGHVLFLNAEMSPTLAVALRDGLKKGLGEKLQFDEVGPAQLGGNLPLMTGDAILAAAIKQHGDAVAIISTIGITDDCVSRVPSDMPPLYILNWQNPSFYQAILHHPRCRGGLFYLNTKTGPVFEEARGGS